ncbi:4-diphosphocytidyl-2-C-methylerythritol kinase [Campylobacter blaseri]|uniref:4-(cytidine 5'-diphospho)-2-C-methyl-D-erythritol kinase n=1 Tax=Campylobacter blaseri TaxID=2042961 RepID=A0A2P8R1X6_9BACT|nr:4-(cytidine 5'-diphospho)-2-C-methyl-D-erythritol kinase [Campylobacter blaseri]PSM52497.1 4-(cytidine 5'-diphospho)-2-C-methyl-D-erythritol kinase [Campylobacter blaseri]PSM54145.1 4-(cytidine 5'-diphospho)-2-C-methyl-D-erythritol kinase [Campylobacter blaseri]QKF85793.1 4-diphosphocytidyl-2-C-methylerythritol kinase [Campylobacter blaseri]
MKSFAKINVFLKIIGTRDNYHELVSRFILVENLYDEISFKKSSYNNYKLNILSNKAIKGENIISKAYNELAKLGFDEKLHAFFKEHDVILHKNIPIGAGLGGGSSNAATFLHLANKEIDLSLTIPDIVEISKNIGSDVAFFASRLKSANVSGVGEIIENFDDIVPKIKIISPNIFSSTPVVYNEFRKNFMNVIDKELALSLYNLSSQEILSSYTNYQLNDLLLPCKKLYPKLILNDDEFLSGSGSSYFKVKGKI